MEAKLEMPTNNRSIPFLLTVYVGVLGTLALAAGFAYSSVTFETAEAAAQSRSEKTVLDERIATAREIKDALRKPIPRPEPLGPITAKLANPPSSNVASMPEQAPRPKIKIPRAAANALAMDQGLVRQARILFLTGPVAAGGSRSESPTVTCSKYPDRFLCPACSLRILVAQWVAPLHASRSLSVFALIG
jgi:hypothetical protein